MKLPVTTQQIREFSKMSIGKSLAYLVADWAIVAGVIAFTEAYWSIPLYIVAVMIIGNRQHSLAIQMHDAAHFRLLPNRRINNIVGEVLCAWPMFFRMAAYRENHNLHHRHANTELDPDFRKERFPETKKEIIRMLVTDALALNTLQQFGELKRLKKNNVPRSVQLARIVYYASLCALLTSFGGWKLFALYWAVPLFTWLKVVLRVRAIADHTGVHDRPHPYNTRTVVPNLFDVIFLAPRQCSYHLGHHFFQSIPSYNLKALHHEMMKDEDFRKNAQVAYGFINVLKEFPSVAPTEQSGKSKRLPA